jgi:hypothetical protein
MFAHGDESDNAFSDAFYKGKQAEREEIIAELKKRWNEESVEKRNQESTTLPRWVRRALGQDAQDMRKFNVKQHHIKRERRSGQ